MKLAKIALLAVIGLGSPPMSPVIAQQAKEPDIMGVWVIYPDPYADEKNTFLELPVPNGGPKLKEPYATQWKAVRAKRDANLKAGTPLVDQSVLCLPEGTPTIMQAIYPLQILQTPGQVTILAENGTQTRRIHLNKAMPAPEDNAPSYYGYSVASWQGDTLVVTTRGVREDVQFFEIPHSSDMTITERIRLVGPGMLEDRIVIDDPKMLVEPYTFTYGYKRDDSYEIAEYFCNRDDALIKVNEDGTYSMKVKK